jgi:hypothetical protein
LINPKLKIGGYPLVRLRHDHELLPFDCEDDDLNDFLVNSAKLYQEDLLAVTYVLEDTKRGETVAFFSVFNDKISSEDFPSGNQWKRRVQLTFGPKKLKDYPAIKIGRLGVSSAYKGKGIGASIVGILKTIFISENRTGCSYITVDAYAQSLGFYEKMEFVYFNSDDQGKDTRQMYYDLHIALSQFTPQELEEIHRQILPISSY